MRDEDLPHCYQRGLLPALIWRSLSGMAVAGTYMPGLRALIDGMAVANRARAAGWYTSFFLLGSSLSFLLGQAGLMRTGKLVNGALGVIARCLPGWCYLTCSPRTASRNTNFRRVFDNRDVLVMTRLHGRDREPRIGLSMGSRCVAPGWAAAAWPCSSSTGGITSADEADCSWRPKAVLT